jgi:hypothetical protein
MNCAGDESGELKVKSTKKRRRRTWRPLEGEWRSTDEALHTEEITTETNEVNANQFGGSTTLIWDSGAGRNICNRKHVPGYTLEKSDHPGFAGPSGETIKVDGKARVRFSDELAGSMVEATFIVAPVTRPIMSGGDINDKGHITISSAKGAFVVDESIARGVCEGLMPHAKLVFSRAGPGRLYEHCGNLAPQPTEFFSGAGWLRTDEEATTVLAAAPAVCQHSTPTIPPTNP